MASQKQKPAAVPAALPMAKPAAKPGDQPGTRLIGTVVPVAALRGERSIGVGEFPDLIEFGNLCKKMGIGLIQILPVNDTGYQSSPYSALTAFALHPLYLRIGDMPEAAGFEEKLAALAGEFEGLSRFPFERILRAKIALLREMYQARQGEIEAKAAPGGSLGTWIEERPWVKEYAVFRHLKEENGEKSWKEWTSHQRPTREEIEARWNDPALKGAHLFWAWVQAELDRQFHAASLALSALGILLEGDLPILLNEDSHDIWAHPEFFNHGLCAGAPPDMYSPEGQNWGFPIYDWKTLEKDDYFWWKERLHSAEKYYQAYRIDHVLGFFRIWATSRENYTSVLGRFVPSLPIKKKELEDLDFDAGRIRWLSVPHIPTGEVWDYLRAHWGGPFQEEDIAAAAARVFNSALNRIGTEELWLFRDTIRGEKDIAALDLHPAARAYLIKAWGNRCLLEYEKNLFSRLWLYKDSRAWASLSGEEKERLEELLERRARESEKVWETQGRKLLSVLAASSPMLPCAEDLGAVPACVPKVLARLKILGLRVVRWYMEGEGPEAVYVPLEDYPELSVCTVAVHDSSTLREWWDKEADQKKFAGFIGVPSLPRVYNPGTARTILFKVASAASRFRVFQIQDLLHLSAKWYAEDPAAERINVPGTISDTNWTYRLPASIREIARDEDLIKAVAELAAVKPTKKKKVKN